MRRYIGIAAVSALLAGGVLLLPAVAATASASGTPIEARFQLVWPRNAEAPLDNAPCPSNTLCATGKVSGYGPATITVDRDRFKETDDPSCLAVHRVETIHLLSGQGDLVLNGAGTICFPGRSNQASTQTSYGHPSMWTFDLAVRGADSTGVFAGASGAVHESFMFAGGVGLWTDNGTLS